MQLEYSEVGTALVTAYGCGVCVVFRDVQTAELSCGRRSADFFWIRGLTADLW